MASNRVWRTLSAFNHSTHRWVPRSPPSFSPRSVDISTPTLSLVSWNIDAFSPRPVARAKLILNHILEAPKFPDIIFLQEVTLGVRGSLLKDARVRNAFLVTDAEDQTSFEDVPFTAMTLLSSGRFSSGLDSQKKEGDRIEGGGKLIPSGVSRIALPSKHGRDALSVDIIHPTAPDRVFRLINVHLDSLGDTLGYRAQQIEVLANILREAGCGSGIIAGDFNAMGPEDHALVDKNELVDAWVALHGTTDTATNQATWGVGVKPRDGLAPGRLDKVAMQGAKAEEVEIIRPGSIEMPTPAEKSLQIPWSDHCGLRCTFTI